MQIGELEQATGISKTALIRYRDKGVIAAEQDEAGGAWEYAPGSVERARVCRTLTRDGFTLDQVAAAYKVASAEEIRNKYDSLPAPDFETWFQGLVERGRRD